MSENFQQIEISLDYICISGSASSRLDKPKRQLANHSREEVDFYLYFLVSMAEVNKFGTLIPVLVHQIPYKFHS